jgi:iron complex transport system substrate-binding protein
VSVMVPVRLLALAHALTLIAGAGLASGFPQTFEHQYGETIVREKPLRVISLDFAGHDNLLALGVIPIAVRHWYGRYPHEVWPWGREALGGAAPEVLQGEISLERIAALEPDLIIAVASGISADQYALLSRLCPVIAPPPGSGSFETPWEMRAEIAGRATGHLEEALSQTQAIIDSLEQAAARHPEWQGETGVIAYVWGGAPGAFTSADPRAALLARLGFVTPPAIDAAAEHGAFYVPLSAENISPLDADLVVWVDDGGSLPDLRDLALRETLSAHDEGREIYAGPLLAGALSHASLLSLPFAIGALVPLIELAMDGDPGTPVPTSVDAGLAP